MTEVPIIYKPFHLNVEQQNIGNKNINSQLENSMIVNTSEIPIERNKNIDVMLPFYKPNPPLNTEWHEYSGEQFVNPINLSINLKVHTMILFIRGKWQNKSSLLQRTIYLA